MPTAPMAGGNPYYLIEAVLLTSAFSVFILLACLMLWRSVSADCASKLGFIHRPMHLAVMAISICFVIISIDSQGQLNITPWYCRFFPWLVIFNVGFAALSHYLFGVIFVLNESTGRSSSLANSLLSNQSSFLRISTLCYLVVSLACDITAIVTDHGKFRGIWVGLCGLFWMVIVVVLLRLVVELHRRSSGMTGGSSQENSYKRNYKRLVFTTIVSVAFSCYLMFLGILSIRNDASVTHPAGQDFRGTSVNSGAYTAALLMIYVLKISWIPIESPRQDVGKAGTEHNSKGPGTGKPPSARKNSSDFIVALPTQPVPVGAGQADEV